MMAATTMYSPFQSFGDRPASGKYGDNATILPNDTEVEQSILSAILCYPETASAIFELPAAVFYSTRHKFIFQAARSLFLAGKPFDLRSTVFALRESGKLDDAGGAGYLGELVDYCPVSSSVSHHCKILIELSERREILIACSDLVRESADVTTDIDSIHERVAALAKKIVERKDKFVSTLEELTISSEEWTSARLSPRCIIQDYLYADIATLAAPGGTGKTTLCLFEAIHVALGRRLYGLDIMKRGWSLFVTSEDPREILVARLREIVNAMALEEKEIETVRRSVLFWDVSGGGANLISMDDGNIVLAPVVDEIIARFQDAPPVLVTFDPIVSFGVGESRVNDNEQALVMAARRIRNGLGCAVRLIHHTGKANAREKSLDQYTARGGSALPDGSRMVSVLQSWTPKDNAYRPPQGCNPEPGSSITILARPKLSYSKPNLPLIWIKRSGWAFEHFVEAYIPDEELDRARLDQVERFLASEERAGVFHSRTSLDGKHKVVGLTRHELRDAIAQLVAAGRVFEKKLPTELRQGGRKTYLAINENSAGFGGVEKTHKPTPPNSQNSTTPPPYRDKSGGGVAPPGLSPFPQPCRESSAGFGGVGGVEQETDGWEIEI